MSEPTSTDSIGKAKASPTKEFFVRMLTRDIELGDALLDLLDNCLDGILRIPETSNSAEQPFAGFYANLTVSGDRFIIEDNCGGIPEKVAKDYAFSMGRPTDASEDGLATIGMYGIGMKRAIFKLGTNASVDSRHEGENGFSVKFTPEWMNDDSWDDLEMYSLPQSRLNGFGTRIEVDNLHKEASRYLGDKQSVDVFRKLVSQHYSLIIDKGFSVRIGTPSEIQAGISPIKPEKFRLIRSKDSTTNLQPFVYQGTLGSVRCEIYAGLYRPPLDFEELEGEEHRTSTSDAAGWTVACNDRVVIYRDKTRLTGWGEAGVPHFHGQFIPITGIVLMYADNPRDLPLTTTKRGIDASSNVYSEVKDLMRDATKSLTNFTNRWKNFREDRDRLYESTTSVGVSTLRRDVDVEEIQLKPNRALKGMQHYKPVLPVPKKEKTESRVSFMANNSDISMVGNYIFEEENYNPSDVGRESFLLTLRQSRQEEL